MATTYTWNIDVMQTQPTMSGHTDVVVSADWRLIAQDGDDTATVFGQAAMGPVEPTFIEYANLTQADVLYWVWESGVDKAQTEAAAAREIAQQRAAPVVLPNPWN